MQPSLHLATLAALILSTATPGLPAQDPWKDLAAGGKRAARVLEAAREGGPSALRELLVSGLEAGDRRARPLAAELLPPELLAEPELARLCAILLENWEKAASRSPLSEEVLEDLNELVTEFFEGRNLARLAEVAGWGDQDLLIQALRGPSEGTAAWAAAGKKGRELREKLAQLLYPVTDSTASSLAARALLDPSWDAQERAVIYWIELAARDGGAYPGDEVTAGRLKALLADRPDKPVRSLPMARLTQVSRSLPYLTSHPEALDLIRAALLESPDGANQDLLWAAIRVLLARSPEEVRLRFWNAGLEPLHRMLKNFPDPLLFLWIAPAMGGWRQVSRPAKELAPILNAYLGDPLREAARRGQLTNDLFQLLLWFEDERLLTGVLEAAPSEDIDALLEAPQDLLSSVDRELADRLAASKHARVAQVGRSAQALWQDHPSSQPEPVLARLAAAPDLYQVEILAECLKRNLRLERSILVAWWEELVSEEHAAADPLAKEHPDSFRDYLAAIATEPARFQAALAWCNRHGISKPFEKPLPPEALEALLALPGPAAEPELPGTILALAPWLARPDREALARKWLAAWTENPLALDAGGAAADFALLRALFADFPGNLQTALEALVTAPWKGRLTETALGGLVRMGHPPGTEALGALLETGLIPTPFLALHACPVRPLLDRIQRILRDLGDEQWELFLQICWGAWTGSGPGPVLPAPTDPEPAWWELAASGRFTEIYEALLVRLASEQAEPGLLTTALQGLALSAREGDEKQRVLARLQPYLEEPHRGHYWTAVLGASYLGHAKALAAREEAFRAGRSFFVRNHLLPWACLERSKALAEFLLQRGLPASPLVRGELPARLGALIPSLDPMRMEADQGGPSWARRALKLLGGAQRTFTWDPVHRGWNPAP